MASGLYILVVINLQYFYNWLEFIFMLEFNWFMKLIYLVILGLVLSSPLRAQSYSFSSNERLQMLETIDDIKQHVSKGRNGFNSAAASAFLKASLSPTSTYDFYLKCYKEINFKRKGVSESEYREWKLENRDYLRSKEHSIVRRLQLKFLLITLKAATISEKEYEEKIIPELIALMDNCLSIYSTLGEARNELHSEATDSVFTQVYNIQPSLRRLDNWARSPMNFSDIYEFTILPAFRNPERIDELKAAWDKRIAQEITLVLAVDNFEAERYFNNKILPNLKWAKYLDMLRAGDERNALLSMVNLISANTRHPQIDQWLYEIEGYISGEISPNSFEDAALEAESLAAQRKKNSDEKILCQSKSENCSDDSDESRSWWMAAISRRIISYDAAIEEVGICDCVRNSRQEMAPQQYRLGRSPRVSDF